MNNQREHIFRGKLKDSDEWVYGVPIKTHIGTFISWEENPHYCSQYNYMEIIEIGLVDSETLGEYTGLTDKNGTRIFEGDILSTTDSNCKIWYVDYKLTAFCANQGNANYSCLLDEFMTYNEVEVIGNVHDAPELVEVRE